MEKDKFIKSEKCNLCKKKLINAVMLNRKVSLLGLINYQVKEFRLKKYL